jgi:two-component system, OmpR family, sensor histidine kinase CiaH
MNLPNSEIAGGFMKLKGKKLFILYWFLLLYIVAVLVFWFIELDNQSRKMTNYRLSELKLDDPAFNKKYDAINIERQRKTFQYIGEGSTFLALILIGAVFMYRAVRRQFTLQKQQENFMMAVTHELKTPIAIAKLNLETLQKHQLDDSKRQRLIQMTLQETNRLNSLASNILISSQLESGKSFTKEEINFSDLVKGSVNDFVNRFPDRAWDIQITNDIEIEGDPLLLQILVNNLIENAIKYSPAGSAIGCYLEEGDRIFTLKIVDNGPGIVVEEKKKVFAKFYRIGSEQTRSAKGTGLGLYLCKKIAADHHASITIEDNKPTGAIFIVEFENNV